MRRLGGLVFNFAWVGVAIRAIAAIAEKIFIKFIADLIEWNDLG